MNKLKEFVLKLKSSDENTKIVLKNMAEALIIRGVALCISLFNMPAFMRYFEDEQILGVWFTVLSVITWILNFDLGIGNGLRNNLVKAISEKKQDDIKKYIASGYTMIGGIVCVFVFVGYISSQFVNWNNVFNISTSVISQATLLRVTRCVFIGIMLQFFLRLISSILFALQKSAVNNFIVLITSILQLAFVLLAPSKSAEQNLIMLSYAYIFFANAPLIVATIIVFSTKLKGYFPKIKNVTKKHSKAVLSLGGVFFVCQILYMIIANTNEFFITQYTDPSYVVEYQIYNKLFSVVGMLFTLALTPLWSTVTKSIAEKNFQWLDSTYRKLKKIALVVILGETLIIPILQFVIDIWLRNNAIKVNYFYAISFAVFSAVFIYQSILSTVVCGIGKMKLQTICYTLGVIFKFIIIYFGTQVYDSWIVVVLANIIILIPYCVMQQISLNRYIKKQLNLEGK